jgi:hypothetical protein
VLLLHCMSPELALSVSAGGSQLRPHLNELRTPVQAAHPSAGVPYTELFLDGKTSKAKPVAGDSSTPG